MNIKRVLVIQVIITLILSVSLFFVFDYTVSLGVILGSSVSYFSLYSLNKRISNLADEEIPELNKNLKSNRNFRFLVLAMVLIVSGFLPQVFNIIAVCFSVLLNKLSIYIDIIIKRRNINESFRNALSENYC